MSSRFGATPKMIGAAAFGYFLGKVSYMDACREKFLTQLPNSNISLAIRKARGEDIIFEVQVVAILPQCTPCIMWSISDKLVAPKLGKKLVLVAFR